MKKKKKKYELRKPAIRKTNADKSRPDSRDDYILRARIDNKSHQNMM